MQISVQSATLLIVTFSGALAINCGIEKYRQQPINQLSQFSLGPASYRGAGNDGDCVTASGAAACSSVSPTPTPAAGGTCTGAQTKQISTQASSESCNKSNPSRKKGCYGLLSPKPFCPGSVFSCKYVQDAVPRRQEWQQTGWTCSGTFDVCY